MEIFETNVSIDDSDMGKIIREPRHAHMENAERPVGGEASWKMANQLLPPSQEDEEEKEPKRKSTDSSSSSSSSSSSLSDGGEIENEEDSEDRNDNHDNPEKAEQRANEISQSEQRLVDKLSKDIRYRNDHGACMVALASRISESTIGHTDNQNNHSNESQSMHRNKRVRYQRRNSFVIQDPPPSLLQQQQQQQEEGDLQESMHQSSLAFFHPADPR